MEKSNLVSSSSFLFLQANLLCGLNRSYFSNAGGYKKNIFQLVLQNDPAIARAFLGRQYFFLQ
jgi:hypothetical protein